MGKHKCEIFNCKTSLDDEDMVWTDGGTWCPNCAGSIFKDIHVFFRKKQEASVKKDAKKCSFESRKK